MTTQLEDRVTAALRQRAADARAHPDLAAVLRSASTGVADEPVTGPNGPVVPLTGRPRRQRRVAIAAVVAVALGIVGVAIGTSRGARDEGPVWGHPGPVGTPLNEPASSWVTAHVALSAQAITIDYGGRTFSPPSDAVAESSVRSHDEEVLSIAWSEHGVDVSWSMRFEQRGGEWWVEHMVLAEGIQEGTPWTPEAELPQDGVRVPLGQPVVGDIDTSSGNDPHQARVRIDELRLLAFRDRVVEADPPARPSTELHVAPELPADVRPTGLYGPPQESTAVLVARDELIRECMADAGFDYPRIPDEVIAHMIDPRAAAADRGYHPKATDQPHSPAGPDELPAADREAYYDALSVQGGGGCVQHARGALGETQDLSPMRGWDAVIGRGGQPIEAVHALAYGDDEVIAAVEQWRVCVFDAVGETAAHPEDLRRIYTYQDGSPAEGNASDHEKDVAVADQDCRQQVGWDRIWHTAIVERERAVLGDGVDEYDRWVREYTAVVAAADAVLEERGIVLPSPAGAVAD